MRLASYFADFSGGATSLVVTPVQHRVVNPADSTAIRRLYSSLGLRLFYANEGTPRPRRPAHRGSTTFQATRDRKVVSFDAHVRGNDASGADNVKIAWITYTFGNTGCKCWHLVAQVRDAADPTLWTGTLPVERVRRRPAYIVQSANGAALVAVDDRDGAYYSLGSSSVPAQPSGLTVSSTTSSGRYRASVSVRRR